MSRGDPATLIRNVAVRGQPGLDVRAGPGQILEISRSLPRRDGDEVIEGAGGEVIPGLHDHHVHLRAAVSARQSADVSAATSPAGFDAVVSAAAAAASTGTWIRVTGWSEPGAGPLDRNRLDVLTGPVPVRVQHRSGALWVLNSAAIRLAGVEAGDLPGIERDAAGQPTGRLYRMDGWLRDRLTTVPGARPAVSFADGLAGFAAEAAARGVTGFTDATPGRDDREVAEFAQLAAAGVIRQRLVLMAPPGLRDPGPGQIALGPQKLILDDATLPAPGELAAMISHAHEARSPMALHCVTAAQLLVSIAALAHAGPHDGDRIEHAGIVPPGCAEQLARLGVAVVTNPGFIADRGDDYRRDIEAAERDWLYPCASLIRAGVAVAAGTDAPFGPSDPWRCIVAATTRRTRSGSVLGPAERVTARRALRLFLAEPLDVRRVRTVAAGQPSDLCVLRQPLPSALAGPDPAAVLATIVDGRVIARP